MKRFTHTVLILAGILLGPQASGADARTWTDDSGSFAVEAEFVDAADGKVRLRKTGGQIISVALGRLSVADREFVRQWLARQSPRPGAADALVEFLTGAKSRGQITARDDGYITMKITVGGRTFSRKYPLDRIHAVTIDGRREVLNAADATDSPRHAAAEPLVFRHGPSGDHRRTRARVDALINEVGRSSPDWWDSVPLDFPKTLDLSWPQRPPPPWNPQKNVGQYMWDVINPNPGKWKSGLRFMHHLLSLHQADPQKRAKAMNSLARMYQLLLEDYARAAFWWRNAGAERDLRSPRGINLATCYWKLGNKQMAAELLSHFNYFPSIKLWADMGETDRALQLAEAGARGGYPDLAYLYAGDACRIAGRYQAALTYFQKVLDVPARGQAEKRIQRNQQRARANIEGIRLFEMLDLRRVADGTYRAESAGYAGQIQVEVTVRAGRIESLEVTRHKEKQFYSAITDTPQKIIQKQGVKGVDAVTSATMTSEAIINATAKALAGGM